MTQGLPTKTLSLTTYHPDEAFIFQAFEHRVKSHSLHSGVIALNYGTFFTTFQQLLSDWQKF